MIVQELIARLGAFDPQTKVRIGVEVLIGDDDYWEPAEIVEITLTGRSEGRFAGVSRYLECSVDMREAAKRSLSKEGGGA